MAHDNKVVSGAASLPNGPPLDMRGRQIFNVSPPTDTDDALTLFYVQYDTDTANAAKFVESLSFDNATRQLTVNFVNKNIPAETVMIPGGGSGGGNYIQGYGIIIGADSEISVDTDVIADTDWVKEYVAANGGYRGKIGFGLDTDGDVLKVDTDVIADTEWVKAHVADNSGGTELLFEFTPYASPAVLPNGATWDSDTQTLTLTDSDTFITSGEIQLFWNGILVDDNDYHVTETTLRIVPNLKPADLDQFDVYGLVTVGGGGSSPHTDTTYELDLTGQTLTLEGSDGNNSSVTLPENEDNPYFLDTYAGALPTIGTASQTLVIGHSAEGDSEGATAIGAFAKATDDRATAYGYAAEATANSAVAIGHSATAAHVNSIALGNGATPDEGNQFVVAPVIDKVRTYGLRADTADTYLTIDTDGNWGRTQLDAARYLDVDIRSGPIERASAGGEAATAVGEGAEASQSGSLALGNQATSDHAHSIALGRDANTDTDNQFMIGSIDNTTAIHNIRSPHFRAGSSSDHYISIDTDGRWGVAEVNNDAGGYKGSIGFGLDTDNNELEVDTGEVATHAYVQGAIKAASTPFSNDTDRTDREEIVYIKDTETSFSLRTDTNKQSRTPVNVPFNQTYTFPARIDHNLVTISGPANADEFWNRTILELSNPEQDTDVNWGSTSVYRNVGAGYANVATDTLDNIPITFRRNNANSASRFQVTGRLQLVIDNNSSFDGFVNDLYERTPTHLYFLESSEFTLELPANGADSDTAYVHMQGLSLSDGIRIDHNSHIAWRWLIHADHFEFLENETNDDNVPSLEFRDTDGSTYDLTGLPRVTVGDIQARFYFGTDKGIYFRNERAGGDTAIDVQVIDSEGKLHGDAGGGYIDRLGYGVEDNGGFLVVDTDVIADTEWVKSHVAANSYDGKVGYGLDSDGGTLNVDTDVIADTEWTKSYIASHVTENVVAGNGLESVTGNEQVTLSIDEDITATHTYVAQQIHNATFPAYFDTDRTDENEIYWTDRREDIMRYTNRPEQNGNKARIANTQGETVYQALAFNTGDITAGGIDIDSDEAVNWQSAELHVYEGNNYSGTPIYTTRVAQYMGKGSSPVIVNPDESGGAQISFHRAGGIPTSRNQVTLRIQLCIANDLSKIREKDGVTVVTETFEGTLNLEGGNDTDQVELTIPAVPSSQNYHIFPGQYLVWRYACHVDHFDPNNSITDLPYLAATNWDTDSRTTRFGDVEARTLEYGMYVGTDGKVYYNNNKVDPIIDVPVIDENGEVQINYLDVSSTGGSASASGTDAIAIGRGATVSNHNNGIALGADATVEKFHQMRIAGIREIKVDSDYSVDTDYALATKTYVDTHSGSSPAANRYFKVQDLTDSEATATGTNAIAIGTDVEASGQFSLAIGNESTATLNGALAMGNASNATGVRTVAIGDRANASDSDALAMGDNALADSEDSVAIGSNVTASGARSLAMGSHTTASGTESIAIGSPQGSDNAHTTDATGYQSISIGANVKNAAEESIALGTDINISSTGLNNVALGDNITQTLSSSRNVLIGENLRSSYNDVIIIGNGDGSNTQAEQNGQMILPVISAIKTPSFSPNTTPLYIQVDTDGNWGLASAGGNDGAVDNIHVLRDDTNTRQIRAELLDGITRVGDQVPIFTLSDQFEEIAAINTFDINIDTDVMATVNYVNNELAFYDVGNTSQAQPSGTSNDSLAIGPGASANNGTRGTAIGYSATATGYSSVGLAGDATSSWAIAIGSDADATSTRAISIGKFSTAQDTDSIAIGSSDNSATAPLASHKNAIAIGKNARSSADSELTFGTVNAIKTPSFTGGTDQFISVDANGNWSTTAVNVSVDTEDFTAGRGIEIDEVGGKVRISAETNGLISLDGDTEAAAVGTHSVAIGNNAQTFGDNSIAIGGSASTGSATTTITFTVTGNDFLSPATIGYSNATVNGAPASASNSDTVPVGTTLELFVGGVSEVVTLTSAWNINSPTGSFTGTGTADQLNIGNNVTTFSPTDIKFNSSIAINAAASTDSELVIGGINAIRTPDFVAPGDGYYLAIDTEGNLEPKTIPGVTGPAVVAAGKIATQPPSIVKGFNLGSVTHLDDSDGELIISFTDNIVAADCIIQASILYGATNNLIATVKQLTNGNAVIYIADSTTGEIVQDANAQIHITVTELP